MYLIIFLEPETERYEGFTVFRNRIAVDKYLEDCSSWYHVHEMDEWGNLSKLSSYLGEKA
jgi:hypothetical protein